MAYSLYMHEAYAYIRISNQNKVAALDSDSKDRQLRSIRKFARTKGWKVKEIFMDVGVSGDTGTDLSSRDAFNDMLGYMKSNGIKIFLVSDPSRLARSVVTAAIITQDLREHQIRAMDASTGRNLADENKDDPENALISTMLMAISQYEKCKVVQRLQSGRRRALKEGRPAGGTRPFGSDPRDEKLIERLRDLRNFAVHGRTSMTEIATILNKEGFSTRRGNKLKVQNVSHYLKQIK
jgi:site-specific DNA recombinase